MKASTVTLRGVVWIIVALLLMPAGVLAQTEGDAEQSDRFSKEELTQMLAPIALYPDSLTAQILMASTYPLEIVEADRWLAQNKGLKGNELDDALKKKDWDPSVKSLCHFPDVLAAMSEKLDQTRKLGDAFLAQEDEVMATVQELRRKARDQGNLKTTGEQTVIVEEDIVIIEPADREVIYVPVYDPYYVYGPWWYPAYPPYYWYYPRGFVSGAYIGFGPRIYIGFDLFSWVWFDWPYYRIHRDYNRTSRFHRPRVGGYVDPVWRHNPVHRRGVAYRDRRTSEVFGSRPRQLSPTRTESRGYPTRRIERQEVGPSQTTLPTRDRRTTAPQVRTESIAPQRSLPTRGPAATQRTQPQRERVQSPVRRDTPFRGIGDGSFERRAVERGGMSIRSSEPRSSGGAFRGGGQGGRSRR